MDEIRRLEDLDRIGLVRSQKCRQAIAEKRLRSERFGSLFIWFAVDDLACNARPCDGQPRT